MTIVYVVLGESGEYSDREVWVAGVYATEADAQAAILERMAVRRVHDEWAFRKQQHYRAIELAANKRMQERVIQGPGQERPWAREWQERGYYQANADAELAAGPEPEYEAAERCELLVCPIGQWGACGEALEEHEA